MKCWECKEEISEARIVHYYSPKQDKGASRNVCFKCLPFLKFNGCHFVEVEKITQRSLKNRRPSNADNHLSGRNIQTQEQKNRSS
jgi:hypothetical protein